MTITQTVLKPEWENFRFGKHHIDHLHFNKKEAKFTEVKLTCPCVHSLLVAEVGVESSSSGHQCTSLFAVLHCFGPKH